MHPLVISRQEDIDSIHQLEAGLEQLDDEQRRAAFIALQGLRKQVGHDLSKEIAAELEIQEGIRRLTETEFGKVKSYGQDSEATNELETTREYTVKKSRIPWLSEKESPIQLDLHTSPNGSKFWFGRITELSNTTSVKGKLTDTQVGELEEKVIFHTGILEDTKTKTTKHIRRLEADYPTSKTLDGVDSGEGKFMAFKDASIVPSGFKPNDVRALILLDTDQDLPVYLVSAVSTEHGDQGPIYDLTPNHNG